jgi:Tfp pilus assembly protein PilF
MRHQEHKIFQSWFASQFPPRSHELIPQAGEFPTMSYGSIGVPGWVFPRVAIIDQFGLNDYVIARNPIRPTNERKMAHDRFSPRGYWQSWAINYGFLEDGSTGFVKRDYELTAEDIINNERFWIDRVVNGRDAPIPYDMLCRIGETNNRMGSYDTALVSLVPAVRMEPRGARGLVGLAQSMSGLGHVDSARTLLEDAVAIEPDNSLILSRLGVAVADQAYRLYRDNRPVAEERFALSISYLNEALARDGCRSEALTELASIDIFRDQLDSSYVYLGRLEICPGSSPKLAQLLGERYLRKRDRGAAMRAFALAIRNGLNINQKRFLLGKYPELGSMIGEQASPVEGQ